MLNKQYIWYNFNLHTLASLVNLVRIAKQALFIVFYTENNEF